MENKKTPPTESHLDALLNEADKTLVDFKEDKNLPLLQINPNGQPIGKERVQPRYKIGGVVFLHCENKKVIRAKSRDLSTSGIGINIMKKLKSYRIGERFVLEFSQPHRLQSVLLPVELARCTNINGHNHLGFRILTESGLKRKILNDYLTYLKSLDPWF